MPKVLIVGGDADANLGDRAIVLALCQCIARHRPDLSVSIISGRRNWPGLPSNVRLIGRRAMRMPEALQAARHDLVLVGGGGLFQDDDSRVKMPYWAARIAMLQAANANIAGHAIGAGPLRHPESRRFARLACRALKAISVRDGFAQRWLRESTGRTPPVVPDPAFMLNEAPAATARAYLRSLGLPHGPVIGVALRRWFHRRGGFLPHRVRAALRLDRGEGRADMDRLLGDLAGALNALARSLRASVLFMPSYNADHEGDFRECRRLRELLAPDVVARIAAIDDPALYKAVAGQLSLMFSARMHPLILATSMGVPGVGLAYNGKFEGLFSLLGVPGGMVWLDDLRRGGRAGDLIRLATDALNACIDRKHRAGELAEQARVATTRLLADLVPA